MRKAYYLMAFAALVGSAPVHAAVLIKTIRTAICVTDTKHPNACKTVSADGSVVVSEDALQALEGELGQGATVMEATSRPNPASGQERHRRHGGGAPQE